jgi:thiamine pyrophosphate-dependent acetolactate synthase large subunit-like protein
MRVYEAIGETLKKLEVQATFGLMGDGNLRFMTHLAHELGMPYYASRHESGAVAMADGYARVTGRVGVCSVTQGPGVTNTLTALTEARKAGSPILLLAGDSPMRFVRHNQDVDQTAIFNSVGVAVERVRTADTVIADVARAFNRAWATQRPIAMQFPTDMQDLPCDETQLQAVSAQRPPASRPPPDAIKVAADLIAAAKRPAIIAGRGAVRADARASRTSVEQVGAVCDNSPSQGLFASNPFTSAAPAASALGENCPADLTASALASITGRRATARSTPHPRGSFTAMSSVRRSVR